MFDIGATELLIVAVVAILVVGPKDLPRMLRVAGHYFGKVKSAANEFRSQFDDVIRESELTDVRDELTKEMQDIKKGTIDEIEYDISELEKKFEDQHQDDFDEEWMEDDGWEEDEDLTPEIAASDEKPDDTDSDTSADSPSGKNDKSQVNGKPSASAEKPAEAKPSKSADKNSSKSETVSEKATPKAAQSGGA